MDKKTEYRLEGHVELPQKIARTWYPNDDVRYTGGFYRLRMDGSYFWGYLFLKKEVTETITVHVRKWKWFGPIPMLKTISTTQETRWHTVWGLWTGSEFSGCSSVGNILNFRSKNEDWWNNGAFDDLKALASRSRNLKLGDELLQSVFHESVTILRRLHIEIYGHE